MCRLLLPGAEGMSGVRNWPGFTKAQLVIFGGLPLLPVEIRPE